MPYLQMTNEEFEDFRNALWELGGIESVQDQRSSETLLEVIKGIEIIREVLISRIFHFLGRNEARGIREEIDRLVEKSCPIDDPDFWAKIKSGSRSWFYFKKSFQLSHLHGIYSRKLEDFDELRDYSYLQLYSDYYESFAQRLRGNFKEFEALSNTVIKKGTSDFYQSVCDKFDLQILHGMDIENYHNEVRNSINHGILITYEEKLEYLTLSGGHLRSELKGEYVPKIRALITYSVLYSTQVDLLLFRELKSGKPVDETIWREYFAHYIKSWKRHKELFE